MWDPKINTSVISEFLKYYKTFFLVSVVFRRLFVPVWASLSLGLGNFLLQCYCWHSPCYPHGILYLCLWFGNLIFCGVPKRSWVLFIVFLISHWPLLSDPIPLLWLPTVTLFFKMVPFYQWCFLLRWIGFLFFFFSVCVFSCCELLNSGRWLLDTSLLAWPTTDNLCSCLSPRNPDRLLPQGWWTSLRKGGKNSRK